MSELLTEQLLKSAVSKGLLKSSVSKGNNILVNKVEEINKAQNEEKKQKIKAEREYEIKRKIELIEEKKNKIASSAFDLSIRKKTKEEIEKLEASLKHLKEEAAHDNKIIETRKELEYKIHRSITENSNKQLENEIVVLKSRLASLNPDKIVLSPDEVLKAELRFSEDVTIKSLKSHINEVYDWSKEVRFRDMYGSKRLGKIYVELDTYLMPARTHMNSIERSNKMPFNKATEVSYKSVMRPCVLVLQREN